jgi:uncharacterized protein (UPF0333 family)
MKNFYSVLFLTFLLVSCSKSDSSTFEINGTFTHTLLNCDNSTNTEINCTEYVWFNDNSTATIMPDGSDFGISTTYTITNNRIDFYYENGVKSELSFEITNETTLTRIDNDDVWLKVE